MRQSMAKQSSCILSLDLFLNTLSKLFSHQVSKRYKIAIYSRLSFDLTQKILAIIDKDFLIWKVLCNEDFVVSEGRAKQDLTKISEDLSRVLLVDWDSSRVIQKENLILIKKFNDLEILRGDQSLIDLADFFHGIMDDKRFGIDLRDIAKAFDDGISTQIEQLLKIFIQIWGK